MSARGGGTEKFAVLVSTSKWPNSTMGLMCLFAVGFVVRLIVARFSVGLTTDVLLFHNYLNRIIEFGPSGFYASGFGDDYPPAYLYVLFVLGHTYRAITGSAPSSAVLKLPAIGADIGLAWIAVILAVRITPADVAHRLPVRAMAASAILLNPAIMLVSSAWGQVDSVMALVVLTSALAFAAPATVPMEVLTVALLAVAIATKPQAALALPPFAIGLAHRHLTRQPSVSAATRAAAIRGTLFLATGAAVLVAMFAPFRVEPQNILNFYRSGGAIYPYTSLWAFNAWGVVGFYQPDIGGKAFSIAGTAAVFIGFALFLGAAVVVTVRSWQLLSRQVNGHAVLLLGIVAMTCVGFVLLTRMHERYLYLAVVALAPLVGMRQFRWGLWMLSLCFFLNLHFVYVLFSQHSPPGAWTIPPLFDMLFGTANDAFQLKALSLVTTVVCLAVAFLGWNWLEQPTVAEERSATSVTESRRINAF